jgi:histidyl-tRNA synthetase
MAAKFQAPKGMNDVVRGDMRLFAAVEDAARRTFALYGYRECRTPIAEDTQLFARGMGETSDVVTKEMYTFTDRGGRSLTLRPEGTAGVVRAFIDEGRQAARWYYLGPMFRYERMQAGRSRQFYQVGIECIGYADARADAEVIEALHRWLSALGVTGVEIRLNSLGDAACRPAFREALVAHLRSAKLCGEHAEKWEKNPLRVLDCKKDECRAASESAPRTVDHLCAACREHFSEVQDYLGLLGVRFTVDPRIVRGLDYYTRTVFEALATAGLGAQNAVAAGGRYDGLVHELGGPDVPGVGWAAGVERLVMLLGAGDEAGERFRKRPVLYIGALGKEGARRAVALAKALRDAGLECVVDAKGGGPGKQAARADEAKALFLCVIGDTELSSGRAKLKEMRSGAETEVALSDLTRWVLERKAA